MLLAEDRYCCDRVMLIVYTISQVISPVASTMRCISTAIAEQNSESLGSTGRTGAGASGCDVRKMPD
jgi:hypothetical protein